MNGYEYAQLLLSKGVQCIPLNEYKTPRVSFKDIPVTSVFLETYQQLYESSQCLGALTRGLWCIDIDRNHADGVDGYESLKPIPFFDELTANMNQTMTQTTPSGGIHIIFQKSKEVEYSQKIAYLPGVDIKANDNNYFVLAGSTTAKGRYTRNELPPKKYEGSFENRIIGSKGNFRQQIMEQHSVKRIFPDHDFSHFSGKLTKGRGGLGKQAYQRIVDGTSLDRNNDLYLAASYAKACNVDIEPLKVLIGTNKDRDVFTESEFYKTVNSAIKE